MKRECPQMQQGGNMSQGVSSFPSVQGPSGAQMKPTIAGGNSQHKEGSFTGSKQKGQIGRPRGQEKAFAMTQHEARESSDVVMGTLTIFNKNAHVLFDPGATHSFVSYMLIVGVDKNLELLPGELVIATPVGEPVVAHNVYRNCIILK